MQEAWIQSSDLLCRICDASIQQAQTANWEGTQERVGGVQAILGHQGIRSEQNLRVFSLLCTAVYSKSNESPIFLITVHYVMGWRFKIENQVIYLDECLGTRHKLSQNLVDELLSFFPEIAFGSWWWGCLWSSTIDAKEISRTLKERIIRKENLIWIIS